MSVFGQHQKFRFRHTRKKPLVPRVTLLTFCRQLVVYDGRFRYSYDIYVRWDGHMQYLSLLPLLRFSGYFKNGARGRAKPRGPRVSSATKHTRFTVFESRYLGCLVSNVLKNHHLYLLEISSHWSISSAVVAGLNFNLYKQHVRSFSPRDSSTRGVCRPTRSLLIQNMLLLL